MLARGIVPDPLRFPGRPRTDLEISTRSTTQVDFYLANGVEVPEEHLARGEAGQARELDGRPFDSRLVTAGLFQVHATASLKPPACVAVAIKHRGHWYYIDDRDQISKSTFALVLQLSRLDFARQQPAAPFLDGTWLSTGS